MKTFTVNEILKLLSVMLAIIAFILFIVIKDVDKGIYYSIMSIYAKVWSDE